MLKNRFILLLTVLTLLVTMLACTAAIDAPAGQAAATEAPAATPMPKIKKLEIGKAPDKIVYTEGEELDDAGTVINAILEDGTVLENVPYEVELGTAQRNVHSLVFAYAGRTVSLDIKVVDLGNSEIYWVENTSQIADDPLQGKRLFFLGSSVTYGEKSEQEGIPEYLDRIYGTESVKEAVSGTTLALSKTPESYVERLDAYIANGGANESFDAVICQLSTNDVSKVASFGQVMPAFLTDAAGFDKTTTFGAMEYIVATAQNTWHCPVFFYTNPPFQTERYGEMVQGLYEIADKWGVQVIDLYNDAEFNDITEEQYALYMADTVHPTRAGYREWWLPKFHESLSKTLIGK